MIHWSMLPSLPLPSLLSCVWLSSQMLFILIEGLGLKFLLKRFLRRSSCSLTKFEVINVSVSDIDLITALKLMPSLVNLHVNDATHGIPAGDRPMSPITSRFIRSLHGFLQTELNPSSSPLVARLCDLKLTFDGLEFDDSGFIDMVSSRWLPDMQYASGIGLSCLRAVTLRFNKRVMDPAAYKRLDYLDKAGMRVVVLGIDGFCLD
ncbi:hypothetical protein BDP27DRAFT_439604 [Rhodocollybia butyracea]|uniref:Uncharacterized protein n=1 Tax=Rhodocollybia butyracea TaxID=206335 RepID=A0A9P5Q1V1_9AGAR|nr:hypothetical protein BDP27DRAFT_439604 [Rhodocollybia butyracea]